MKKLLVFLMLLLPLTAWADDFTLEQVTTEDGLTLSYYATPQRSLGGDTAELLIQSFCMDGKYEDAYALNLLLAEHGDTEAMIRLGNHHLTGLGAIQDDAAAIQWYQHALDSGNDYARYNLALAYLNGWGVEHNPGAAAEHLTTLASNRDAYPLDSYAVSALKALEPTLANAEAPLPEALTVRPLPYSDELLADSAMQLGYFWHDGAGGIVDHTEAARWFEKAIELSGDKGVAAAWSHAALAKYYRDGTLGMHDIDKALEHARGLHGYYSFAGDIYFFGITAEDGTIILAPDVNKAFEYYLQGADSDSRAIEFVADCYYTGEHLLQDYDKAVDLYLTGMQLGSAHCAHVLEGLYTDGRLYAPEMLHRLAWTAANGSPAEEANDFLLTLAQDFTYGKTAEDGTVLVEAEQHEYAFWVLNHLARYVHAEDVFVYERLGWFYCGNVPDVRTADYRFAHFYYAKATMMGSGFAAAQLGLLYRDGLGVEADPVTARICFEQAVELGYEQAQTCLDALPE